MDNRQVIVQIFKNQLKKYAGADQSSVSLKTGEKILSGVQYSLIQGQGVSLNEGLPVTGKESLEALHKLGQRGIIEQLSRAKNIWSRLETSKLASLSEVNIALSDSLKVELPKFFSHYDPVYFCAEIPCLLDYPPAVPISESHLGVSYILAYLEALEKEAKFIERFQVDHSLELLKNVPFNLKEDLRNLYEFVFLHHLCQTCLLPDDEVAFSLLLSRVQKSLLLERWTNDQELVKKDLTEAFEKSCTFFSIEKADRVYYEITLKNRLEDLERLDKLGQLATALIDEKVVEEEGHFLGKALPDEAWRQLYSDLLCSNDLEVKMGWIKEKINHIVDLIDLIKAEALTEDEIAYLLKSLSEAEKRQLKKYIETFERDVDDQGIYFTLKHL